MGARSGIMQRREFLRRTVGVAAGALAGLGASSGVVRGAAEAGRWRAGERVGLGRTGISVSRVAMGTGSSGWGGRSNQTQKLGTGGMADLLEEAFERGINFWDAADQYGSHPHLKEGLRRVDREQVVILTKTNSESAEGVREDLERFRRELGTERIDIVLLHCKTDPRWPEACAGAMEALAEAKAAGTIRAHGVSCHSFGALQKAAATDWVDVDLARINPAGAVMDAGPEEVVPVLERMHAGGKGVIGMKVFGAGRLIDRADECLRYVMGLDCVSAFSVGLENRRELRELVERMERVT